MDIAEMDIEGIVSDADSFAHDFIKELTDSATPLTRKQAYMLDNSDKLKSVMEALQAFLTEMEKQNTLSEEEETMVDKGAEIINDLRSTLAKFQEELSIDANVSEEDIVPTVDQDSIQEAMQSNYTTRQIAADFGVKTPTVTRATTVPYNYAMLCDGAVTLITAKDNDELNKAINKIADQGSYKNIQLFKASFSPVPLKQKTILSV